VEGDTELYLVPTLAKLRDIDFEQLGITVCSVGGTNFEPYVKLLGTEGLNVPFAVVTDGDPDEGGHRAGVDRLRGLLSVVTGNNDSNDKDEEDVVALAKSHGLFMGEQTFEIDLFRCGRHNSMCTILDELTQVQAAKRRAEAWKADPATLNSDRFIKDIKVIGKGRFAQRLATRITGNRCPDYITEAVTYLTALLS
jgi:putative ATP-dependent endonuclease of the OLD family